MTQTATVCASCRALQDTSARTLTILGHAECLAAIRAERQAARTRQHRTAVA
ncbi:hypothetical protein AB0K53_01250 [Streptomyces tuirus]|uniref:hypothetical protein n=1 Tax=Streptomyces tuirus TaxID=68278 RepID=UPI00343617F5